MKEIFLAIHCLPLSTSVVSTTVVKTTTTKTPSVFYLLLVLISFVICLNSQCKFLFLYEDRLWNSFRKEKQMHPKGVFQSGMYLTGVR